MSPIEAFTTWQLKILDRLIPDPTKLSADNLRRARLLVGILFYAFALNIILIIVRYENTGWSIATTNSLISQFAYTALLVAYKLTNRLNFISDLAIGSALVFITITISNDGGLTSRATTWLAVFPLVAQSIAHRIKAKTTVIIIFTILIAIFWGHSKGIIVSHENQQVLFARALSISMVVLFVAIVSLIYDNSRRILEKQLRKEKENAEQAFKLKSEFLATMSHELRTPFNGVLGMLELLSSSSLTEQQRHRVALAKSSAESLLLLINDILDFSKIEAGKQDIESIDFNGQHLFGNIVEAMAYQANEKGIEIVLDTHNLQQTEFKGDPNRLRQVTTNLLSNAIKFTSKGEVLVTVKSKKDSDNHTLLVDIKDSGIGIPKDKLNILFNSFTQVDASTSRKFGGSGLGLAIAKNLCELMGGDINVTSKEGAGSTFSFTVALLDSANSSQKTLPNLTGKTITVIDDNQSALTAIYNQLLQTKASISTFNEPKEALHYLSTQPQIDLMLIDVNMPNLNGIQLVKKIRENKHLADSKIVFMTNIDTLDGQQILDDLGVTNCFPKPATYNDIEQALNYICPSNTANDDTNPLNNPTHKLSTDLSDYQSEIHILVVDDSPINLEVAAALLDSFDIQPVLATSAEEAFKILSDHPKKNFIHGIIMDCQMPNIDGFEATKAIRSGTAGDEYKDIPIIALTANAMAGDKERCLSAGMNDYLTKPININNLVAAINTIVKPNMQ